jgi:hypothetical protein
MKWIAINKFHEQKEEIEEQSSENAMFLSVLLPPSYTKSIRLSI